MGAARRMPSAPKLQDNSSETASFPVPYNGGRKTHGMYTVYCKSRYGRRLIELSVKSGDNLKDL